MIPLDDPMSLSLLFHLNSEPWLNDRAYSGGGGPQKRLTLPGVLAELVLPPPPSTALSSMFRRRFSCRKFQAVPIALDRVASLLDAGYGAVGPLDVPDPEAFPHRTVPSAGGLFPLEPFVIMRRIDGAEDGLYHYNATGRALSLLERGDLFPRLEPMFYTFPFIADANIVIALAAIFRAARPSMARAAIATCCSKRVMWGRTSACARRSSISRRCAWGDSSTRRSTPCWG